MTDRVNGMKQHHFINCQVEDVLSVWPQTGRVRHSESNPTRPAKNKTLQLNQRWEG